LVNFGLAGYVLFKSPNYQITKSPNVCFTMICRSCGHQIAANAIVCYKCGTPTEIPAPVAKPRPAPSRRAWWSAASIGAGLVGLELWALPNTDAGTPARWAVWAALVLTAVAAAAWLRRR
jgi:LPXTG-motif cell wall-anchored protein